MTWRTHFTQRWSKPDIKWKQTYCTCIFNTRHKSTGFIIFTSYAISMLFPVSIKVKVRKKIPYCSIIFSLVLFYSNLQTLSVSVRYKKKTTTENGNCHKLNWYIKKLATSKWLACWTPLCIRTTGEQWTYENVNKPHNVFYYLPFYLCFRFVSRFWSSLCKMHLSWHIKYAYFRIHSLYDMLNKFVFACSSRKMYILPWQKL